MFTINHSRKYARPNKRYRRKVVQRLKTKALREALVAAWKDFCTTSSFVGFRYIYRKNRMIIDFLFWILLVPVLMYLSITFVGDFLERYHSLAMTTVIHTQQFPSPRSVFPAVTACPGSFGRKSKVDIFVDKYINTNTDLKKNVNLTEFLKIFEHGYRADATTLSNAARVFSANNLTMRDVLHQTTEDCDEIFTVCRFAGKITPCGQIFQKTLVVGGYCCSFNYPYSAERIRQHKWLRTITFGLEGGLSFAFKIVSNQNYIHNATFGNTLRVLIHGPGSIPVFKQNDYFVSRAMEHALEITNIINTADTKVKNLPVADRDCIFIFEKSLSRFVMYSNDNCLLQCRIDRVIKHCGCVSYLFPSNNSETCSPEQFPCSYTNRRVGAVHGRKKIFTQYGDCDCPDDCIVIKRSTKINSWKFTTTTKYSTDDFYTNVTNDQGIVHIYYGKSTAALLNRKLSFDEIELAYLDFVPLTRTLLPAYTESSRSSDRRNISENNEFRNKKTSIGGIVALFLGCSFVSVLEIIYFLTVRMLKFYK